MDKKIKKVTVQRRSYSNGKLLLTGEYVVLDGAVALAVPTTFGQDLVVETIENKQLIWSSFTNKGVCWFEAVFDVPKLRLATATFSSSREGNTDFIAETLQHILQEAQKLNPCFLSSEYGFSVKTTLTFPRNWGLGSSSTLINNIAHWAEIDAYQLLWSAFSGSGYDIACAQNSNPLFYQLKHQKPVVKKVNFNPDFKDQLFFIHLNQKQNSRDGIIRYKKNAGNIEKEIRNISAISSEIINTKSLIAFSQLMEEHEQMISSIVNIKPVKERLFSDYFGTIKSLGAWGGDFILVTGNEETPEYFRKKGYKTILPYREMVL
ncbi:MAG: GHMP kinase [Flavobacteriaceae bacterium]|nr:MAG: GHMP kinase [Flavobacteriaceae bacterium]